MPWFQNYDPLGRPWLSTVCAALPIVALLGSLAFLRLRAHTAALIGLGTSLLIAVAVFGMPAQMALASAVYGAAFGLLPIGWIVLNVIFLYQLTAERGLFTTLRQSITGVTTDRGCNCCWYRKWHFRANAGPMGNKPKAAPSAALASAICAGMQHRDGNSSERQCRDRISPRDCERADAGTRASPSGQQWEAPAAESEGPCGAFLEPGHQVPLQAAGVGHQHLMRARCDASNRAERLVDSVLSRAACEWAHGPRGLSFYGSRAARPWDSAADASGRVGRL